MKKFMIIATFLALAGCSTSAELQARSISQCQKMGISGSGMDNCVSTMEKLYSAQEERIWTDRAVGAAAAMGTSSGSSTAVAPDGGIAVYDASQCIGAVVNGICNGSIMPNGGNQRTCHGEMINGICTGPMF